jgi:hypothetical protein
MRAAVLQRVLQSNTNELPCFPAQHAFPDGIKLCDSCSYPHCLHASCAFLIIVDTRDTNLCANSPGKSLREDD